MARIYVGTYAKYIVIFMVFMALHPVPVRAETVPNPCVLNWIIQHRSDARVVRGLKKAEQGKRAAEADIRSIRAQAWRACGITCASPGARAFCK
jgi:ribosomal protein L15E